jgi:hypothetical protein
MHLIRRYRSLLLFLFFVVACSALVIHQFTANQGRHVELREAFILLHSKGYQPEAKRLFQCLLDEVSDLSSTMMWDDYQRTLTLVDPTREEPDNLIWQYHWTVSHELEKRSESSLEKALKMAREQ